MMYEDVAIAGAGKRLMDGYDLQRWYENMFDEEQNEYYGED